jgi:hypothetical protein
MWLDGTRVLKFTVSLRKMNSKNNMMQFYHKEFAYNSGNDALISISRDFNYYYTIDDIKNKQDTIVLRPGAVEMLRMLFTNNIFPWFYGSKTAFVNKDGELNVVSKKSEQMPLDNKTYIEFRPIVIYFDNTAEQVPGVRLTINRSENLIDIPLDKFMEFASILIRTDMINYAANMLTYVKSKPYGTNLNYANNFNNNFNNSSYRPNNSNYNGNGGGFF